MQGTEKGAKNTRRRLKSENNKKIAKPNEVQTKEVLGTQAGTRGRRGLKYSGSD